MMDALQKAHDMNMPDLEQQLLKIDKTLYSSGLSLYLMQNLMQGEVKTSNSGITPMVSRDGSLTVSFTEASRKLLCIHAETASEQGDELPKWAPTTLKYVLLPGIAYPLMMLICIAAVKLGEWMVSTTSI